MKSKVEDCKSKGSTQTLERLTADFQNKASDSSKEDVSGFFVQDGVQLHKPIATQSYGYQWFTPILKQ